jgi:hypothetical protein
MQPLRDRVAVVAGATRGAGKLQASRRWWVAYESCPYARRLISVMGRLSSIRRRGYGQHGQLPARNCGRHIV